MLIRRLGGAQKIDEPILMVRLTDKFHPEIDACSFSVARRTLPSPSSRPDSAAFSKNQTLYLSNRFHHRPWDDYIIRLKMLPWPFTLILVLDCSTSQFTHDAPRKRVSPRPWFDLLEMFPIDIPLRILLWCVLLARGMRLIHKFDIRVVRCTFFCVGRYFCVRFSFRKPLTTRPDHPKFDRRRGFSHRATAPMVVATVVNFLLSTLNTGSQVATFIMFIRKGLILDIDYLLSEKQELVNNASRNTNIVGLWAQTIPVSGKLSLSDPVLIHAQWSCGSAISLSFGGLGPSSQIDGG